MNLLISLAVFIFFTSCSNTKDKLNIFVNLPKNIVKIENKHAIFLSPESFKIKKEIKSEENNSGPPPPHPTPQKTTLTPKKV